MPPATTKLPNWRPSAFSATRIGRICEIEHNIKWSKPKLWSNYEPTRDTPYLALTGEPWGVFSVFFGEKIPRDIGSTLYNDTLQLFGLRHNWELKQVHENWKPRAVTILTSAPVVPPEVVVMITHGASSDDKAGSRKTPGLESRQILE